MTTLTRLFGVVAGALFTVVVPAAAGPFDGPGAQQALVCSACHGFAGQSRGDTVPILAGIDPAYFKKAIADYASGRRPSTEMEPYAKMVTHVGVNEIAAYFAAQRREPTPIGSDSAAVQRGRVAATPCVICHGADGKGDAGKLIPNLAGQPPGYIRNQLLLFKQDQRSPGDAQIKAVKLLIQTLSEDTIADLAAYYSSLR
jgi:cytochrome c553